ncbi:GNAT family N-acetyltransferase [Flaviflagellibacter deserti]|uniref:GNAT family N-acetyltransferase n=1 Tax=Flaviflagellibacter deserti TaxID=2267266 RepID=A0ABV9Z8L6_9HYPH
MRIPVAEASTVRRRVTVVRRRMPASDLPAAVPLEGQTIRLEPLDDSHIPGLTEAASDERIWGYSVRGDTATYLDTARKAMADGEAVSFVVIEKATCRVLGMSRLFEIDATHKRLELGYTWYIPEVWGTRVNPEAKLLLLTHAFEDWGARRVQFKIHHANLRSQAAVKKLGAVQEGVLRAHMIQPDGSRRDSVVLSIIRDEWPAVKARLEERLG